MTTYDDFCKTEASKGEQVMKMILNLLAAAKSTQMFFELYHRCGYNFYRVLGKMKAKFDQGTDRPDCKEK
jgi:hypothetical protein